MGDDGRAPWPYVSQREAARRLGVEADYLVGMANNPIPAFKSTGRSGGTVWLFHRDAINALALKLGR